MELIAGSVQGYSAEERYHRANTIIKASDLQGKVTAMKSAESFTDLVVRITHPWQDQAVRRLMSKLDADR